MVQYSVGIRVFSLANVGPRGPKFANERTRIPIGPSALRCCFDFVIHTSANKGTYKGTLWVWQKATAIRIYTSFVSRRGISTQTDVSSQSSDLYMRTSPSII